MVVVDVLIIGGGPHALTLASLLSSYNCDPEPGHDSPVSPSDPPTTPPEPETPGCGRKKKKRRRAAADRTLGGLTDPALCPRPVAPPLSLCVVDSYGVWTSLWESQFSALNIPHLRSHTLVHTDPLRKKALLEFVLKQRRSAELHSLPDQVYILDQNAFFNDMRLGKKEKKRLNFGSSLRKSSSFSLPGTKLSVDFFRDQVDRSVPVEFSTKGSLNKSVSLTYFCTNVTKMSSQNWFF